MLFFCTWKHTYYIVLVMSSGAEMNVTGPYADRIAVAPYSGLLRILL